MKGKVVLYSSAMVEWLTPPEVLDLVAAFWPGGIDLDPCAEMVVDPLGPWNVPAVMHFDRRRDGLLSAWGPGAMASEGFHPTRVFVNPPYGRGMVDWAEKALDEWRGGRASEILFLAAARTDTRWWQVLREFPVCLIRGRLKFSGCADAAALPWSIHYLGRADRVREFVYVFSALGDVWERVRV